MNVLGIDPGKKGALAVAGDKLWVTAMPETLRDLWDEIQTWRNDVSFAWIERVSSSPQMGVKSSFTFGRGYGNLEMALTGAGIPFDYVTPTVWQKAMGCLTKGQKNVTKAKAQQLYPNLRWTHTTADAVLIATYGLRKAIG